MKILILFIISISYMIICGVISLITSPGKGGENKVTQPLFVLIIGIICAAAFVVPACILYFNGGKDGLVLALCIMALLGCSLINAYINCRIEYNNSCFVHTNYFGRKTGYEYKDISGIDDHGFDIKLYVGKKRIIIDAIAVGKQEFLALAKKEYRKSHDGKAIPTLPRKKDIFNGKVKQPGEFIFCYILISLLIIGVIIFMAILSRPYNDSALEHDVVSFSRYEFGEECIYLYTSDGDIKCRINGFEGKVPNSDELLGRIAEGEEFSIAYKINDEEYLIRGLGERDGSAIISLEAAHDYDWGGIWQMYLLFGGMGLLWGACIVLSIYVARNSEKFSRRVIRLFFKDGYVIGCKDEKKRR